MIDLNSDTLMYWQGCFVSYGNSETLYKIIDVVEEEIYNDLEGEYEYEYRLLLADKDGDGFETIDATPFFTKLGYRNIDKTVAYISRSKVRYYKKGLHPNNLLVTYPQEGELYAIGKDTSYSLFDLLPKQKYPSLSEAIDMIEKRERYAVALHNWWAIILKAGYDKPLLYYRLSPIGEVADGEVSFYSDVSKHKFEWEVKK